MKRPPQISKGVGTTGVMVLDKCRFDQQRNGLLTDAVKRVLPHTGIDVIVRSYDYLRDEYQPLEATAVEALKRAMRSDPAFHHVADAIDGVPDADVRDGHRGNMAVGFANGQLRLSQISANDARALAESRDVEAIQLARDVGLNIDNTLPTSVVFAASALGTTGANVDIDAAEGKVLARSSAAAVEQKLLLIGGAIHHGTNGLQRTGNQLAVALKVDFYQSHPAEVYCPRYGRAPIRFTAGERMFKICRYISPTGQSSINTYEKFCEVGAAIVDYDHNYSGPADAFFQNAEDDAYAEGRHWSTAGEAGLFYDPSAYRNEMQLAGEIALIDRLLAGEEEIQEVDLIDLVAFAKSRLETLARSSNTTAIKKILAEGLLKIGAAPRRFLSKTLANIESELNAAHLEEVDHLRQQARVSADEFLKESQRHSAAASARGGLSKALKALEALEKRIAAGEYRAAPNPKTTKSYKALVEQYDAAVAQFNEAIERAFKIGARDFAAEVIKAAVTVIMCDVEHTCTTLQDDVQAEFLRAVQNQIRREKESIQEISAKQSNAKSTKQAMRNTGVFGIGRRLPTDERQGAEEKRIWTAGRLAPLVTTITAKNTTTSAAVAAEIVSVIHKAVETYAMIPPNLCAYLATLPDEELKQLFTELKVNSCELAGLNLDAVRPGRVPMRHSSILMPEGHPRLQAMASEVMKANHTGQAVIHWDRQNEMRTVTDQRGIFLGELREIAAAATEIGEITLEFWANRPVLVENQRRILDHRAHRPQDLKGAEHALCGGIWTGEIVKSDSQEYRATRALLSQRMSLRPGQAIGRGINDVLQFLACNENARRALLDAIDHVRNDLGADEAIKKLHAAHADAASLVPASFVQQFQLNIEEELERLTIHRIKERRTGRLADFGGNDNGNGQQTLAASKS